MAITNRGGSLAALLCASVFVAAVTPGAAGFPSFPGDINADQQVDILDVQEVVSHLVVENGACAHADANGDGCIDILDLQLTLAALRAPLKPSATPERKLPEAFWRPFSRTFSLANLERRFALIAPPYSLAQQRWTVCAENTVFTQCRTERYLYRLTPNAPPTANQVKHSAVRHR